MGVEHRTISMLNIDLPAQLPMSRKYHLNTMAYQHITSPLALLLVIVSIFQGVTSSAPASKPLKVHNITRIQGAFENLAIRSNGQIPTTSIAPTAAIYQVDPMRIFAPALVATLPHVQFAAGIQELATDVFYVAGGNLSFGDPKPQPGTLGLFELDVRNFEAGPDGKVLKAAKVRKVAALKRAELPNGVMSLPDSEDFVLVADSLKGVIFRVAIGNGNVHVAFNDTTLKGQSTGPITDLIGVNGIEVFHGMLYYTNTGAMTVHKVPISKNGLVGAKTKPVLVSKGFGGDALIVNPKGIVYVAANACEIYRITLDGRGSVIAGKTGSTGPLVGLTALRFGRLATDGMSLYVTTNGGMPTPVEGTQGISRVDVFKLDS